MQEFSQKTSKQMLEFASSKPARAAQQYLADRYPQVEWTARSFSGHPLEPWGAQFVDPHGNLKVLRFVQRGIAWLIEEVPT